MSERKLDTREARTEALTSREMAKLFCAQILPASKHFGRDNIRVVLTFLAESSISWKIQKRVRKGKMPTQTHLVKAAEQRLARLKTKELKATELVFGGLVGGLCNIADPDEVRKAVEWCVANYDKLFETARELIPVDPKYVQRVVGEVLAERDAEEKETP